MPSSGVTVLGAGTYKRFPTGRNWLLFQHIGCFYTRGRIIRLDELEQTFVVRLVMRLYYQDGHKTNYAFGSAVRRPRTDIMRLVPVLKLETHNKTNNKWLPKFVQTDNASSGIKTAIGLLRRQ